MRETFRIKNVDIEVDYNDFIYTADDVKKMLKYGVKSLDNFCEIQAEIDIINENEMEKKLFPKEKHFSQEEVDYILSHLNIVNRDDLKKK